MADGVRIRLAEKLEAFDEHWFPKLVDTFDAYDLKLVKIKGAFVWHSHADADEVFLVLDGAFRMEFRDRTVDLGKGELIVVPRGVEHRPVADKECSVMLIEKQGVVNTGDAAPEARTRAVLERI